MSKVPLSKLLIATFDKGVLIGVKDQTPIVALIKNKHNNFTTHDIESKLMSFWGSSNFSSFSMGSIYKHWINNNWNNLEIPLSKTIVIDYH